MRRDTLLAIRSEIHALDRSIPPNDRSKRTELERDLLTNACVALWDMDHKRLVRSLNKLTRHNNGNRGSAWGRIMGIVFSALRPL